MNTDKGTPSEPDLRALVSRAWLAAQKQHIDRDTWVDSFVECIARHFAALPKTPEPPSEGAMETLLNVAKYLGIDPDAEQARHGYNGKAPASETIIAAIQRLASRAEPPVSTSWRCFHCDETFTDAEGAREHFGAGEPQWPACQIDIIEYRRMEEANRRHCEEDTDLHRQIHRLESEHQVALQREEEAGYAKGLKDGRAEPPVLEVQGEPSPLPVDLTERSGEAVQRAADGDIAQRASDLTDLIQQLRNDYASAIDGWESCKAKCDELRDLLTEVWAHSDAYNDKHGITRTPEMQRMYLRAKAALGQPAKDALQVGRFRIADGKVVEWEIDNCADERADGTYPLYTSPTASGNPATARSDEQMNGEAK